MYEQWQKCLSQEIFEDDEKEQRQEERKQRKEQKLLQLQHELQMMEEVRNPNSQKSLKNDESFDASQSNEIATPPRKKAGLSIFNRLRKSSNNLNNLASPQKVEEPSNTSLMNRQNKTELRYVKPEIKMVRSKSSQNIS